MQFGSFWYWYGSSTDLRFAIEFVERLSLKFMIEQETESSQLRPAGTERKRESGREQKGHRVI